MFFDTSAALETVRQALVEARPANHKPIREMSHHHDAVGGKMIRASLALTAGAILEVAEQDAIAWACTCELLHNASLIHDDMCDGDAYRRGHPSVWSKFGSAQGLCFGDWMIAKAFLFASGTQAAPGALSQLAAQSFASTVEGQTLEVACAASRKYPNWGNYSRIATQKTAPLLALPVAGMIVASKMEHTESQATLDALNSLSDNVGFAYQINNDIDNLTQPGEYQQVTDVARATPNAVAVRFREELEVAAKGQFDRAIAETDPEIDAVWVPRILKSNAIKRCSDDLTEQLSISAEKLSQSPQIVQTMLGPVVDHLNSSLNAIPQAHAMALGRLDDIEPLPAASHAAHRSEQGKQTT